MTTNAEHITAGPRKMLREDHVIAALKKDKGADVQLMSWEVKDFSEKVKNISCYVTSVEVKYSKEGTIFDVTYVIKLNPGHNIPGYHEFMYSAFVQEGGFYMNIAPEMKSILAAAGMPSLNVPEGYYASKEIEDQVIFMEDMRSKGFKPFDMFTVIDVKHVTIALDAIARFHAASYLLMKNHPEEDLANRFEPPKDTSSFDKSKIVEFYNRIFRGGLESTYAMLTHLGGYEKIVNWIQRHRKSPTSLLHQMSNKSPPFDMICHGDLGKHNMLFRYDDTGNPIDVTIVDLQDCKLGSVGKDLNHFLYLALEPKVRKPNKDKFLATYWEAFNRVVEAGGEVMPFTLQELRQEFKNKQHYGLMMTMVTVAYMVITKMEATNLDANFYFGFKTEEDEEALIRKVLALLDSNPESRPVIFEVLEEFQEDGLFD